MIKKGILTMVTVLIMIIISALPIQAAGSGNYLITNMNLGLKIFGLALFLMGMGLIFFKHKRIISIVGCMCIMCAIITLCVGIIIA